MKKYSIVIPVLHEGLAINELIVHLKGLAGAEHSEIIVVDGSAEGDTLKAIEEREIVGLMSSRGRARQMNAGAGAATGGCLIFLHADTRLPLEALMLIDEAMTAQDLVGGAFDLGILSNRWIYKVIAVAASQRSRLTRIPYGDQAIFIRRTYFNRMGGYPDIPLMEDVALMKKIRDCGARIHLIPQRVGTSPRRWEKEGILYTTLRNRLLMAAFNFGVSPERLSQYYRNAEPFMRHE